MSSEASSSGPVDEMGPIDYLIAEFPGKRQPGSGLPLFLDLVDRVSCGSSTWSSSGRRSTARSCA